MGITQQELGRRIEAARKAAGWSQGQLAEATSLNQSAVSRIESGERSVDSLELAAIAASLKASVLDLLEAQPVADDLAVAARKHDVHAAGAVDLAVARVKELIGLGRLLDDLGVPDEIRDTPPSVKIRTGEPYKDQGREIARDVRKRLNIGDGPILDLVALVEDRCALDVSIEPLPEGLVGLCVKTSDTSLALVDSAVPWSRQRFTLAHELCHHLVGDPEPICIDEGGFGTGAKETRANAFAAHFLMPVSGVTLALRERQVDEATVAELQQAFGVSLDSLLWQLRNVPLITGKQQRAFKAIGSKSLALRAGLFAEWQGERDEAERTRTRPPARLWRRALAGYARGVLGIDNLARLLNHSSPEQLRRDLEDAELVPGDAWIEDDVLV